MKPTELVQLLRDLRADDNNLTVIRYDDSGTGDTDKRAEEIVCELILERLRGMDPADLGQELLRELEAPEAVA